MYTFKKALEIFKIPRLLTEKEQEILATLNKAMYIPGLADPSDKWQETFANYQAAKKNLQEALDPEKESFGEEEIESRWQALLKWQKALQKGIQKGEIEAKYTEGKLEVKVYPLDFTGSPGQELKEETYYIPDGTPLNLLVQVD